MYKGVIYGGTKIKFKIHSSNDVLKTETAQENIANLEKIKEEFKEVKKSVDDVAGTIRRSSK